MTFREIRLPTPPNTRKCNGPDDWGDVETVGLHLKRKDRKGLQEGDFAVYLGMNEVGIKSLDLEWEIIEKIKYESLEAMKEIWMLD